MVGPGATVAVTAFKAQYRNIHLVCDVAARESQPELPDLLKVLDQISLPVPGQPATLTTYAMCVELEDQACDSKNLELGLELSRRTKGRTVQILLYQSTRCGFAALFPERVRGQALSSRLHAFGMKEDIYTWDVLLHESEDRLARALHEDYWRQRQHSGAPVAENPAWQELRDDFKESNRHAADHLPVKLRALGYHEAPLQPERERVLKFEDHEISLLAKMEHARWCAERWLANWEHAPKTDRAKKLSCALCQWDALPSDEQKKDPEQVNAIFRVLEQIGHGIYR